VTTPALPLKVGALVFPGFELLDVFGPLELFGLLYERATISLLAMTPGPVPSAQGPACVAEAAFRGDLGLDVLLVPGGRGTRPLVLDGAFLLELGRQCAATRLVASVCTGSALLAKAGVLDGLRATTNKRAYAWATSNGPQVNWVAQARWVEDGKVFTSSGVSAGMDMALALIARLTDRASALQIAAGAEYEWHEDAAWDPFAALNGLA
jgi:transcriptional regulator GlxA family with amidase domain